jgi:hypothetical protein
MLIKKKHSRLLLLDDFILKGHNFYLFYPLEMNLNFQLHPTEPEPTSKFLLYHHHSSIFYALSDLLFTEMPGDDHLCPIEIDDKIENGYFSFQYKLVFATVYIQNNYN